MATTSGLEVTCPVCRAKVAWIPEQRFKPFCSERCKLIDLGDWATEAHKIPCEPAIDDLDTETDDF